MPRAWHKRHNRLVADISFFFAIFFIYFLLFLFYFLLFSFSFFFDKKKDEKDKTWICLQKIRISTNISSNRGDLLRCYVVYFDLVELIYAHTFTHIFDFYTNGVYRERRKWLICFFFLIKKKKKRKCIQSYVALKIT